MSAFGNIWTRIDQVPWSSPQSDLSYLTFKSFSFVDMAWASSGLPGAGYSTWNSFWGNPPKSCIVLGLLIAVTKTPLVSQWAEILSIALGFGKAFPNWFHNNVCLLFSIAFMGLPWPTNTTGILVLLVFPVEDCMLLSRRVRVTIKVLYFPNFISHIYTPIFLILFHNIIKFITQYNF